MVGIYKRVVSTKCSRCDNERVGKHRYCKKCQSEYMRQWRKLNPLTEEQKLKDRARSYAGVYKRRGKLIPQLCACGNNAEMHHEDYTKPLDVLWICRPCHLKLHGVIS
jgi:hypothetical protein